MQRSCLKCGAINDAATGSATEACPACGAIYSKVESALTAEQSKAADRRAEVLDRAAAAKAKKDAEAEWEIKAEAIRAKARDDLAAEKLKKETAARIAAQEQPIPTQGLICAQCGTAGNPKRAVRGSMGLEIALWLIGIVGLVFVVGIVILIVALVYSIWRMFSRRNVCRKCGSENLIPLDSPRGQAMASELLKS